MRLQKSKVECDHDGGPGCDLIGDTVLCLECYGEVMRKRELLLGPRHVGWW